MADLASEDSAQGICMVKVKYSALITHLVHLLHFHNKSAFLLNPACQQSLTHYRR